MLANLEGVASCTAFTLHGQPNLSLTEWEKNMLFHELIYFVKNSPPYDTTLVLIVHSRGVKLKVG